MRRKKQLKLRLLRRGALVLTLIGLFLFNLHVNRREPPLVRIGDISQRMNFSTVRVEGLLKSDARTMRGGAVFYLVADETGSLSVFHNSATHGPLPKAGSRISVTGQLSVGTGNQMRLRVHEAEQIVVLADLPTTCVCGEVAKVWMSPPDSAAPHRITLTTPNGLLEVVHWFDPVHKVDVGDRLEVTGRVGFYRGRMQLKVQAAEHIRLQSDG